MDHRIEVALTDAQYRRLIDESRRTGLTLAELVRRAIGRSYGSASAEHVLQALDESFGGWSGRNVDGRGYVEALRRGTARRIAD